LKTYDSIHFGIIYFECKLHMESEMGTDLLYYWYSNILWWINSTIYWILVTYYCIYLY